MHSATDDDSITGLLGRWAEGDRKAFDRLLPRVLGELRDLASRHLAREPGCHTLQPTALVHEAYLRMIEADVRGFETRRCFFAFASQLIRRILVDHARSRLADKRGGQVEVLSLGLDNDSLPDAALSFAEVLSVHHCLERLAKVAPRQSRVAELRFFAGLTVPEVAEVLNTSTATVERSWRSARRRLALELARAGAASIET